MSDRALNGADFRATVRLSNKANETLADVGETCVRVPSASLPWLIETHRIEAIALAATVAPTEAEWADLGRPPDAEARD